MLRDPGREAIEHLGKIKFFAGLPAAYLRRIADIGSEEEHNGATTIFSEGEKGDKFYLIVEGAVRISRIVPGMGEEALAVLRAGNYFGEMSLIDDAPRSATAVCHERCRLFVVNRRDLDMADRFFARYGSIAIFIGRLLPVVRTFISLPAGIARMPMLKFQIYTFVGSWPWCFALAFVGYKLGDRWNNDPELRSLMHSADGVIVVLLLLGVIWHVWRHFRHAAADKS